MPSFRDAFPSKWLKAADCTPPLEVTIARASFEDVGSGTNTQRKLVLYFRERENQGFVLNITNANLIAGLFGTDDYDQWVGRRIRLVSVKVQFKDKMVDGIRVEPTRRPQAAKPTRPAPPPEPDDPLPEDAEVGF